MDSIPSPFSQYIAIQSDQRLLACWWGVPVRLSPEGGIDDRVAYHGRIVRQQPDPSQGLLLLTDKGLVHCRARTSQSLLGPSSVTGVVVDVKIPGSKTLKLDVRACPGLDRPLFVVSVDGDAATFSPEYVVGQIAGTNEIHFLLDEQADPQEVLTLVQNALHTGEEGGPRLPASTGPTAPEITMLTCPYCGCRYRSTDEKCPDCGAPQEA